VLLRAELDALAQAREADLWYVIGSRHDAAPRATLTSGGLRQLVPDLRGRDVYLCGPPGLVEAATAAVLGAGVPRRQVHDTAFEL
jgi:ferredoxin-NADP reductase